MNVTDLWLIAIRCTDMILQLLLLPNEFIVRNAAFGVYRF